MTTSKATNSIQTDRNAKSSEESSAASRTARTQFSQGSGAQGFYCPHGNDGNIDTKGGCERTEPLVHYLLGNRPGVPDVQLRGSRQIARGLTVIASPESLDSCEVCSGKLGS